MSYDALVVGGGPAGSTAARFLVNAGKKVAVIDRATFPRVKLCAGWLSDPIWDALDMSPASYPRGIWRWERCHVFHRGRETTVAVRGYFIRRYEFDDYLLGESGAEVLCEAVKTIERDGDEWVVNGRLRAPYLIGAGGTHCPVGRLLAPERSERPVGAQELELRANPAAIAMRRIGRDGEPELYLHDDFGGYSWNIPKTNWLNVGTGTMDPRAVRAAWAEARAHFDERGHLPLGITGELESDARGHSYYLFDPLHLGGCQRDGALLVGDSLGLAQPLTAEGILPAVVSGRLAAEAICAGDPASYRQRLAAHPTLVDYDLFYRLRMTLARLRDRAGAKPAKIAWPRPPALVRDASSSAVAHGFGWMFGGRPVPAGRMISKLVSASRSATAPGDRA